MSGKENSYQIAKRGFKIHTSTPSTMDISLAKYYEQAYLQGLDNDSGYVSHNHESNFEASQESFAPAPSAQNPVYLSEDALLEEPKSLTKTPSTKSVYEEFTNVYYLNSIIDTSAESIKMNFSGLQDSDASITSNISPELNPIAPIVSTVEQLELYPIQVRDESNENTSCNNVRTFTFDKVHTTQNFMEIFTFDSANMTAQNFTFDKVNGSSIENSDKVNQIALDKHVDPFDNAEKTVSTQLLFSVDKNINLVIDNTGKSTEIAGGNSVIDNVADKLEILNSHPKVDKGINFMINDEGNLIEIPAIQRDKNADKSLAIATSYHERKAPSPTLLADNDSNMENDVNILNSDQIVRNSMINVLQDCNNSKVKNLNSNKISNMNILKPKADIVNSSNILRSFSQNCSKNLQNSQVFQTSNKVLQNSNRVNILGLNRVSNRTVENDVGCNRGKRKRSLSKTPQKQGIKSFNSNYSPDMFSDEEPNLRVPEIQMVAVPLQERYVLDCDRCLVRCVRETLGGVLPPPSLTTVELSVGEMLEKIELNGSYFWDRGGEGAATNRCGSFMVNTDLQECLSKTWPRVLEDRYHGLHYNRSKVSEELESLCSRYSQRYIGSETQSSCTIFDVRQSSPSKRKSNRLRWAAKSPGRRLSHLARRRITFSSANLLQGGAASAGGSSSRQVMMDARRYELLNSRKSPRKNKSPRKTPRKSPRKAIRTPSSSAKKRLMFRVSMIDDSKPGPSSAVLRASATKRALFQSPEKKLGPLKSKNMPSTSNPAVSPWKKRLTPKRALFSSPLKASPSNKRKRQDNDDYNMPTKIARSLSLQHDLVAAGSGSAAGAARLKSSKSESTISRNPVGELSAHHKKKLQWAVYEALRSQSIGVSHPQFKQFASGLARVTRKLLPDPATLGVKKEGTSERMLRIAKQHVFSVTKGKTVDEIIQAYEASRSKVVKPTGYVSKEAAAPPMDVSIARGKDSVFQDKANTLHRVSPSEAPVLKPANRQIGRPESKIERVKKIINFDDDGGRYSFR